MGAGLARSAGARLERRVRRVRLVGCVILVVAVALAAPLECRADWPPDLGDLVPGTLDFGTSPPTRWIDGDGQIDIFDVLALLRAVVGLDVLAFVPPVHASCPEVPGDVFPGQLDRNTSPPTWHVVGDGAVDIFDVLSLLRVVVNVQVFAPAFTLDLVDILIILFSGDHGVIIIKHTIRSTIFNDGTAIKENCPIA